MRVQIHRLCSVDTDCLLTEKKSIAFFCSVLIGRDWVNDGIRGMKGEKKLERKRERENKNLLFGSHTQAWLEQKIYQIHE